MSWENQGGPWGKGPGGKGSGGRPPADDKPDLDEFLRKGQDTFRGILGGGGGGVENKRALVLILVGVLFFWGISGFYKVDSKEVGVILRFGEFSGISSPGLRYQLPFPIEKVHKLGVLNVNTVEVGYRRDAPRFVSQDMLQKERLMLTGDQNIVEITFDVQWKIDEAAPQNYLFNVRDPQGAVGPVAESVMREVIGKIPISDALSKNEGKLKIELDTQELIQQALDVYGAGIRIIKVNLLTADPPAAVIDAFREVKTAEQDKKTLQNQAEAYRNEVIPKARGQAEQITKKAEGYKETVVAEATGNAARFISVYNEYRQAKDITRKRMYLEMMEKVLKGTSKLIVDSKNGGAGVLPYLPLDALKPAAKGAAQ